ncbi:hypothetical protein EDD76_12420 [Kineothrix alysoides]|uniref:Uncharacterized protein n=1 Tax=Kineothrix alysoides TaxID=1469948 RepID=A0A4R1QJQ3_9FIRM|nr:hypothetical protein EDD76_12420 [Kineothrix alysoides]
MHLWVWPNMMSKKASVSFNSDDTLAFIMHTCVLHWLMKEARA